MQLAEGAISQATERCGAKTRDGTPCKAYPVNGSRRCRMHGGTNPGRPVIHGMYSVKHRQSLSEKAERFESFVNDLGPELVLLRVLLQEYLDRFEDGVKLSARDVSIMKDMVDAIGRTEERRAKIRKDTAFGAQEMQLFISAMSAVLRKYVPSDDLPDAINELRAVIAGS